MICALPINRDIAWIYDFPFFRDDDLVIYNTVPTLDKYALNFEPFRGCGFHINVLHFISPPWPARAPRRGHEFL